MAKKNYEDFPLSLALFDALPVIFFSVAMIFDCNAFQKCVFYQRSGTVRGLWIRKSGLENYDYRHEKGHFHPEQTAPGSHACRFSADAHWFHYGNQPWNPKPESALAQHLHLSFPFVFPDHSGRHDLHECLCREVHKILPCSIR